MKYLTIILIILCTSCIYKKDKKNVNVNDIDDKIYIGMPKKEVIEKFGMPKDSIMSDRLEKGNYYYIYATNDFTGYTLKIFFDNENNISYYGID